MPNHNYQFSNQQYNEGEYEEEDEEEQLTEEQIIEVINSYAAFKYEEAKGEESNCAICIDVLKTG